MDAFENMDASSSRPMEDRRNSPGSLASQYAMMESSVGSNPQAHFHISPIVFSALPTFTLESNVNLNALEAILDGRRQHDHSNLLLNIPPPSPRLGRSRSASSISSLSSMSAHSQPYFPSATLSNTSPFHRSQSLRMKEATDGIYCRWQGCIARHFDFGTTEALDHHLQEVHAVKDMNGMYKCEWEGCQPRKQPLRRRPSSASTSPTAEHQSLDSILSPSVMAATGGTAITFSKRSKLILHLRLHSGFKPFQCKTCGKTFARTDLLTAHERRHSVLEQGVEKKRECRECGKHYLHQKSLIKHQRSSHPDMSMDEHDEDAQSGSDHVE